MSEKIFEKAVEFNEADMLRLSNDYSDLKIKYYKLKCLYEANKTILDSCLKQENIVLQKTISKLQAKITELTTLCTNLTHENNTLQKKSSEGGISKNQYHSMCESNAKKNKTITNLQEQLNQNAKTIFDLKEEIKVLKREKNEIKTAVNLLISSKKFQRLQMLTNETSD